MKRDLKHMTCPTCEDGIPPCLSVNEEAAINDAAVVRVVVACLQKE